MLTPWARLYRPASLSATEGLVPTRIRRREVGEHDVLIDFKYSGIFHGGIHTVRGEWGGRQYPLVFGHEIAGMVSSVGSWAPPFAVGDRVGVDCPVSSWGECIHCHAGHEQCWLEGNIGSYGAPDVDGTNAQGGYAAASVANGDFMVNICAALDLEVSEPLLCAGITTYSPLRLWGAGPSRKVAVIGLGELGLMAVKIAHAMGAEVTVLSRTLKKQEDGLKLGSTHYFATENPETFQALAGSFDLIINTVSKRIDISAFLQLLSLSGTLVKVGAPAEPLPVNVFSLISGRRLLAGSMIGGISQTQEMLDFCAEHQIAAEIEVIAAEDINKTCERALASDVRYRFIIDTATF